MLDFKSVLSVTLILFSVIDIIGNLPIVIDLRKKAGHVQSGKATIVAGVIMIGFLFLGESILGLFGIDVQSFAVAGAIILFIIGIEMVLGIELFKHDPEALSSSSIVPLAFPLLAGAGTMTTIISLRAEYDTMDILAGIVVNLVLIYIVLKASKWVEIKLGKGGTNVLRKVFGIILLAIAIKLFKSNINL
ncbi:MAG: MarC family protein [Bacteroidota bacterium]